MSEPDIEEKLREKVEESAHSPSSTPWMYRWPSIAHYYGDTVRQLQLSAAAIMLLGAPYYSDDLGTEIVFILSGVLALVLVSALTNPWKQTIISIDAVISGVGLVIFETWALMGFSGDTFIKFSLRQFLALLFLFAFYFSTKTLRAMILHQIGKMDARDEFFEARETEDIEDRKHMEFTEETREWIHEHNEEEKQLGRS